MINLLLLCGPSGSGKSYIENELIKNSPIGDYKFVKLNQVTTREKRDELDPYIFISYEKYQKMEKDLIAKTVITSSEGITHYYGTIPKFKKGKKIIHTVVVNKKGIIDMKQYIEEHPEMNINLKIFMITSDNPVKRVDRNEDFIKKEIESLNGFHDMFFVNHPQENSFINVDDIYEGLKITGMIQEEN